MRLFAEFVRGHMISFTVRDSGRGMGVGGKVVEFCDSIVRTLWHGVLLSRLDDDSRSQGAIPFVQRA